MNLIKLLLFFLFFVQPISNVFAQTPICNYVVPHDFYTKTGYSAQARSLNANDQDIVLNVKFHTIYGPNGENQHNITESHYLKIIEILNVNFNQFRIFFKYRGYNSFNDGQLVMLPSINGPSIGRQAFIDKNLYDFNAVNIFYTGMGGGGSGHDYTGDTFINPFYFYYPNYFNYLIVHEMGHTLGLNHLDSAGSYVVNDNLPQCKIETTYTWDDQMCVATGFLGLPNNNMSENVTRDPLNPKYNADSRGDRVIDTAALFWGIGTNYCRTPDNLYTTFNKDPRVVDNSGDPNTTCYYCFSTQTKYSYTVGNNYYTTLSNDVSTNIPLGTNTWQSIVNTVLNTCTQIGSGEMYDVNQEIYNFMFGVSGVLHFTPGQGIRMRETILNIGNSVFNPKMSLNDDGSPDISVLYEPFALGAVGGSSNTPSGTAYAKTMTPNEDNTGVNVWNCGPFVARYQTGFNCEFSNMSGQVVSQTPSQQYNATCNGYIGVKIPIFGDQIIQTMEPMCFSSFEPYIKGEIKSLDHIGSFYFTIEELDSIKATNPNLYLELQSGKYHIIIKETASGYIDEKLIYKN